LQACVGFDQGDQAAHRLQVAFTIDLATHQLYAQEHPGRLHDVTQA